MKKLICSLFAFSTLVISAQSGQKWASDGNAATNGDFVGTTNNVPLLFKANNVTGMSLSPNGVFNVNGLSGTGSRFLQADYNGNLIAFPAGNSSQVLYGNGTWGSLPAGATSWQLVGNNLISVATGNIGIGTTNPQYKLDVIGDVSISNNLYVGGGIVITDHVKAAESVTTSVLQADSIKMGGTRALYGTTRVEGDIDAKNKLTVTGNSIFNGIVTANQGIDLGNNTGLRTYVSANPNVGTLVGFGSAFSIAPNDPSPCVVNTSSNPNTNGWVTAVNQGFYSSATNNGGTAFLTMYANKNNGNGYIDVSGAIGGGGPGDLYINQNCNRSTFINWAQGASFIGAATIQRGLIVGGTPINTGYGSPAVIANVAGGTAFEINTTNSTVKAFSIKNNVFSIAPFLFSVMGDGKTIIGSDGTSGPNTSANSMLNINTTSTRALEINNTSTGKTVLMVQANGQTILNTNGITTSNDVFVITNDPANISTTNTNFKIKASGEVYARYMKVSVNNFPDYVFGKDYVLPSLKEVEAYYKLNKHLAGIPSAAEVEKDGLDIAEMNKILVKKIEELTIYTVEQNKKQEEQQAMLIELQKQIEALKKSK